MENKLFKDIALLLACGTGILYVMGRSYYSGYLGYWGLSTSYLPLTTPELLEMGFAPFAVFGAVALNMVLPIIAFFLLLSCLMYWATKHSYKKLFSFLFKKKVIEVEKNTTKVKSKKGPRNPVAIVRDCLLIFVISAIAFTFLGAEIAENKYNKIIEKKVPIIEISNKNKTKLVSIIGCSHITNLCGVFVHKKETIEILGLKSLENSKVVSNPIATYERVFSSSTSK